MRKFICYSLIFGLLLILSSSDYFVQFVKAADDNLLPGPLESGFNLKTSQWHWIYDDGYSNDGGRWTVEHDVNYKDPQTGDSKLYKIKYGQEAGKDTFSFYKPGVDGRSIGGQYWLRLDDFNGANGGDPKAYLYVNQPGGGTPNDTTQSFATPSEPTQTLSYIKKAKGLYQETKTVSQEIQEAKSCTDSGQVVIVPDISGSVKDVTLYQHIFAGDSMFDKYTNSYYARCMKNMSTMSETELPQDNLYQQYLKQTSQFLNSFGISNNSGPVITDTVLPKAAVDQCNKGLLSENQAITNFKTGFPEILKNIVQETVPDGKQNDLNDFIAQLRKIVNGEISTSPPPDWDFMYRSVYGGYGNPQSDNSAYYTQLGENVAKPEAPYPNAHFNKIVFDNLQFELDIAKINSGISFPNGDPQTKDGKIDVSKGVVGAAKKEVGAAAAASSSGQTTTQSSNSGLKVNLPEIVGAALLFYFLKKFGMTLVSKAFTALVSYLGPILSGAWESATAVVMPFILTQIATGIVAAGSTFLFMLFAAIFLIVAIIGIVITAGEAKVNDAYWKEQFYRIFAEYFFAYYIGISAADFHECILEKNQVDSNTLSKTGFTAKALTQNYKSLNIAKKEIGKDANAAAQDAKGLVDGCPTLGTFGLSGTWDPFNIVLCWAFRFVHYLSKVIFDFAWSWLQSQLGAG